MKLLGLSALCIAAVIAMGGGCGSTTEVSSPQEWAFEMEKVWELEKVGTDEFLRPGEPRVADDGTLYFHDFDRKVSYIIDADGGLVKTFAPRGDDTGAVSFYINSFPAGDNVVICAPDKLHFFTRRGQFVKAVPNNLFARFPLAFKSENEFWLAPGALGDSPEGSAAVTNVNLLSGEETNIHEFALTDEEKKPSGGAVIVGLTPQLKMGYDRQSDRIYYGKNTDTTIYWSSCNGDTAGSFTFTAIRQPVTEADLRSHFSKFNIPEERVNSIIGILPDRMACYNRIQVANGLVYLFRSDGIGHTLTGQVVDVFSPKGRHLYHGRIEVEDGWQILNPENLQLAGGFAFAVQENDAGDRKIVKYKVSVPEI